MATPSAADRPGPPKSGTEPLPRYGSRAAQASDTLGLAGGAGQHPPAWPDREDVDTGPVPIVGDRPSPPPRPADPVPASTATPLPAGGEELPTTERPAGGRAGRDLRAAIGVGVGLVAVIVAS